MSFQQDLNNLTRDMHDASWEVEYIKKNPVLALMLERKSLQFKGGNRYYREVDTDTTESLAQAYSQNDTLTHGVVNTTSQVLFRRKKIQFPVQIDEDEELENASQTPDGTQLHNLAKLRVRKSQEGLRMYLRNVMYRRTGHAQAATDSNKYMQGLNNALTIDHTYGEVTRTTGSNIANWWQPEHNLSDATAQSTTAQVISISFLRQKLTPLEGLEMSNQDLITLVGPTLKLALIEEAEARGTPYKIVPDRLNQKDGKSTQGFSELILDGRRIVSDPYLALSFNAAEGLTSGAAGALERRLYCLNLLDWDFFIHPKRNFKMSQFFDQSLLAGGSDFSLARIKFAGNINCWHPNRQLMYENVTP